ncbi:MAG: hypothetical protein L0210_08060 [Rhodospirillales bacterium]|nr:hypothetical protein [Rhodospirillales bacterium]
MNKVKALRRLSFLAILLLAVAGPLAACDNKESAENAGGASQESTATGTTTGTPEATTEGSGEPSGTTTTTQ